MVLSSQVVKFYSSSFQTESSCSSRNLSIFVDCHFSGLVMHHAELQQLRIRKDEEVVSAVVDVIQGWINPYAEKQDLISISNAKTAPRDIVSDLLKAYEV